MPPSPRRRSLTPPGPSSSLQLDGELWLNVGHQLLGGAHRIGLLKAIAEVGSITHAAKAIGLSYKAAWDAIDTMNNLAGEPLVERSAGGRGGGSTRLTGRGQQLVARYEQLAALHQRFVQQLSAEALDLGQDLPLLKTLNMKTSARNQFLGTVSAIRCGAVNDEVELTLPGGARLTAIVTRESLEALGLRPQAQAIALVKSSWVMLATGLEGTRLSARNQLPGTVEAITPGAVNGEVVLALDGGGTIAAVITQQSITELGLQPGVRATAFFKASSVLLAVTA